MLDIRSEKENTFTDKDNGFSALEWPAKLSFISVIECVSFFTDSDSMFVIGRDVIDLIKCFN